MDDLAFDPLCHPPREQRRHAHRFPTASIRSHAFRQRFVLPWLALTLFLGAFYHWSGLNIQPFRAESGLFIAWAYSGDLSHFMDAHIYSSYSGHYTPLFFAAELLQARLFGASEHLWFWRQILLLGLLGTALVSWHARRLKRWAAIAAFRRSPAIYSLPSSYCSRRSRKW